MKKNFLLLTLIMIIGVFSLSAQGTSETVNVPTPGTLEDIMVDIESTRIESLTITGSLDAYDIAYIIAHSGKMSKVKHLDISGVQLVPGDHPYAAFQLHKDKDTMGGINGQFYISDTYHEEETTTTSPLGGSTTTRKIYSNNLSGAFAHTQFSSIVLPNSIDCISQYMFIDSEYLEELTFPAGITEVEKYAFSGCTRLTQLPSTSNFTTIGEGAFNNSAITEFDLKNVSSLGAKAFNGSSLSGSIDLGLLTIIPSNAFSSTGITAVTLSPNLILIEKEGFFECTSLNNVTLPEGLTTLEEGAFKNCKSLTHVTIPSTLSNLASDAFENTPFSQNLAVDKGVIYINNVAFRYNPNSQADNTSIVIKEGCTAIADNFLGLENWGDNKFKNSVTSLILPSTLKRIGDCAFGALTILGKIELPEGLEYIGDEAFRDCSKLYFDKLPDAIQHIGYQAFRNCDLTEVTLPANLTHIGPSAFEENDISLVKIYSTNLELERTDDRYSNYDYIFDPGVSKVVVGANVSTITAIMFGHCTTLKKLEFENRTLPISFGEGCFSGCSNMTATNFPTKIDYVGAGAFALCESLNINASILSETTYIGDGAFEQCGELTGNLNPTSAKVIGKCAFYKTGISSVVIPETVTFLGTSAFAECPDLKEVTYRANPEHASNLFTYTKQVIITPRPAPGSRSDNTATTLDRLVIGKNVTTIKTRMCYNASIKEVIFEGYEDSDPAVIAPGNFTIEEEAFSGCKASFSPIPTNTTSIGEHAFYNGAMESVVIPASVKELGKWAFTGGECKEAFLYPEVPPTCENSIPSSATVYVCASSLDAYKNNPSYSYFDLQPMPGDTPGIPTRITLRKTSLLMNVGDTFQLEATVTPEDAENKDLTWESLDTRVATVDQNGTVTAIGGGETDIVVSCVAAPKVKAVCHVEVEGPETILATSIKLNFGGIDMNVGATLQMEAIIQPDNATNKTVTWTSDNEEIVTIDSNGLMKAIGAGVASITATTTDGSNLSATTWVEVKEPTPDVVYAESLTLSDSEIHLIPGDTYSLGAQVLPDNTTNPSVEWQSDAEDVATVDDKGNVLAHNPGCAIIYCRTTDGTNLQKECVVYVDTDNILVTKFTFDYPKGEMIVGEMMTLKPYITPENATNKTIDWYSSDETIATIDQNATITALKAGEAQIYGITTDGSNKKATMTLTVKDDPAAIDGVTTTDITVSVKNGKIIINGKDSETPVEIFSIDGRLIYTGTESDIEGLRSGVYIIRIAGTSSKVAL